MIRLHRTLLAGALLVLASTSAQAAGIIAGGSFGGINVAKNGTDLSTSTLITAADTVTSSPGTGALAPPPLLTSFGPNSIDLSMAASGFGFSLTNATYGTFTGTTGTIVQQTADFIDLYILGSLTVGAESGPASVRISINLSGTSLSEAITLNAPPASIPEPTSVALAGIGLAAAGLVGLRKRSV